MLFAFYGTDVIGVRTAAHDLLSERMHEGDSVIEMTPQNFDPGAIENCAGSTSLFWGEQMIVIDTPSGSKEMFEFIFDRLDLLAESPNTFVIIEEELRAPEKKKLEKYAKKCIEMVAQKEERFNVFALTDALLRRDKKSLWTLLIEARQNDLSNEEIIGTLYWQIKILRLAERTKTAEEAGQKPFVYTKAKRALAKFKEGELDRLSRDLLTMYHEGHLGRLDLDSALERWVLAL